MKSAVAIKASTLVACAALGCGAAGSASAQSATPAQALLTQPFVVNLGTFLVQTDLKARLEGQSTNNPEVDFDQTFGKGDKANRVRLDMLWRITPTHHVSLMYFDTDSTRTKAIDRQINWGDAVYDVGATVTSDSRSKVGAISYEYAFMREANYEVAASLGLHITDFTLKLSGDASVNGAATTFTSQSNSATAPLPMIGLRGAWAVAPQLLLEAQGQVFKLNGNGYGGSWSDLQAKATWMFNRNFGIGLGYDRYYNHLDLSKTNFTGSAKLGYSGLQAFVTGSF